MAINGGAVQEVDVTKTGRRTLLSPGALCKFSPDRKHRVVITQFEKEFFNLDRPVDLRVNLEEVAKSRVIDQVFVGIAEDRDVGSPSVAWDLRRAIVTNLEREHALTITLRRAATSE